jgi:16S rRNA (guanine1207-N2)-methyltransferase
VNHSYFDLLPMQNGAFTKPGVPSFPWLELSQTLLLEALEKEKLDKVTDLSARGGTVALALQKNGARVVVSDSSAAALSCLAKTNLPIGIFDNADAVIAILNGERGNARVMHMILEAWRCTKNGGVAFLAGDKDKGFERYFKQAKTIFGTGEMIARGKGFRVAKLEKTLLETPTPLEPMTFAVEARGQTLQAVAHAGTFASGKLDAASALLLEYLPSGSGRTVLDIGAGYGVLSGFLALEGAKVTMLEDDALSVQSASDTLAANGLTGLVLHSDVDLSLESSAKFDLIVMNPPFHIGKDMRLDVAFEFIAAAKRRAAQTCEVYLVANHFLPYETPLSSLGKLETVVNAKGFKVLKVTLG